MLNYYYDLLYFARIYSSKWICLQNTSKEKYKPRYEKRRLNEKKNGEGIVLKEKLLRGKWAQRMSVEHRKKWYRKEIGIFELFFRKSHYND